MLQINYYARYIYVYTNNIYAGRYSHLSVNCKSCLDISCSLIIVIYIHAYTGMNARSRECCRVCAFLCVKVYSAVNLMQGRFFVPKNTSSCTVLLQADSQRGSLPFYEICPLNINFKYPFFFIDLSFLFF